MIFLHHPFPFFFSLVDVVVSRVAGAPRNRKMCLLHRSTKNHVGSRRGTTQSKRISIAMVDFVAFWDYDGWVFIIQKQITREKKNQRRRHRSGKASTGFRKGAQAGTLRFLTRVLA